MNILELTKTKGGSIYFITINIARFYKSDIDVIMPDQPTEPMTIIISNNGDKEYVSESPEEIVDMIKNSYKKKQKTKASF